MSVEYNKKKQEICSKDTENKKLHDQIIMLTKEKINFKIDLVQN